VEGLSTPASEQARSHIAKRRPRALLHELMHQARRRQGDDQVCLPGDARIFAIPSSFVIAFEALGRGQDGGILCLHESVVNLA
jgi:hypothetical protein